MDRPDLLLLDVNETLSDLGPLAETFTTIGLAPHQVPTWFAQVLREGFRGDGPGRVGAVRRGGSGGGSHAAARRGW